MSVDAADMARPADAAAPPLAETPTPGELLRAGREGRDLSVQQVADELHLDVRLVQAIESNDFLALGAPVYARGHLRKYAAVVGLPPELIIAHYEKLTDVPAVPTVIPTSVADPPPERMSLRIPVMIIGGAVTAGLAVWLTTWLVARFDADGGPATVSRQPTVASPAAQQVQPQTGAASSTATPLAPEVERVAETPATEVAEPIARTAANGGAVVSMRLDFSEASWVEIYDADERRLAYGIGQPGQTRVITGTAPLRVTLGVASAVVLHVNDQPVVVPRRANRDATRFTVAADGSLD